MKRTSMTLALLAVALTACNEHPLKSVEYDWYQTCGDVVAVAPDRPNVMLVLDKSGSMTAQTWDHDGDPATPKQTRWESLYNVTADVLSQHGDEMDFGAVLFPADGVTVDDREGDACVTADAPEVPVGQAGADQILSMIPDAKEMTYGGTPTRDGLNNAVDHLLSLDSDERGVIVLVTDGAANCVAEADYDRNVYDEEVENVVTQARLDGIPTYVVGIDITAEHEVEGRNLIDDLDAVAVAGGATAEGEHSFYNVTDQTELDAALDEIVERVMCTVPIGAGPEDEDVQLYLNIGAYSPRQVESCADGNGFYYTDEAATEVRLCGLACDQFLEHGRLTTWYDCSPGE